MLLAQCLSPTAQLAEPLLKKKCYNVQFESWKIPCVGLICLRTLAGWSFLILFVPVDPVNCTSESGMETQNIRNLRKCYTSGKRGKQMIVLRCEFVAACCFCWRISGPFVCFFSTLTGQIQSIEGSRREYFWCFWVWHAEWISNRAEKD